MYFYIELFQNLYKKCTQNAINFYVIFELPE